MGTFINGRNPGVRRAGKTPAALGRWTRDLRRPSLRMTPREVDPPPPDVTAQFATVPSEASEAGHATIQLRDISARETMPFLARTSACPYLECRSSNRRCLSASPAPISLERQVRYCLNAGHRTCKYYRKTRGLAAIPPTQAAFYTAAAVTVMILIALAGLG